MNKCMKNEEGINAFEHHVEPSHLEHMQATSLAGSGSAIPLPTPVHTFQCAAFLSLLLSVNFASIKELTTQPTTCMCLTTPPPLSPPAQAVAIEKEFAGAEGINVGALGLKLEEVQTVS